LPQSPSSDYEVVKDLGVDQKSSSDNSGYEMVQDLGVSKADADASFNKATSVDGRPQEYGSGVGHFDLGPTPVKPRDLASGKVSEQEEQRGGGKLVVTPDDKVKLAGQKHTLSQPTRLPNVDYVTSPDADPATAELERAMLHAKSAGDDSYGQEQAIQEAGSAIAQMPNQDPSPVEMELRGAGGIESGVEDYTATFTHPERFGTEMDAQKARKRAGTEVVGGAGEMMMPLASVAAPVAPVATALGFGAGFVGGKAAGEVTKQMGGDEEAQELAEQIGWFLPSTLGMVSGIRGEIIDTPAGGKAGIVSALGDKVAAGVAEAPEGGVTVAGKIGKKTVSKTFGGKSPAGPAIEPPTIEGEIPPPPQSAAQAEAAAQTIDAIQTAAKADAADKASTAAVTGTVPIPPAPEAPAPAPQLTDELIDGIKAEIQKAPPEQRAQLIAEAHGQLAQALLEQGKVMLGGKFYNVENDKQAANVATKIINEQLKAAEKDAAEDTTATTNSTSATEAGVAPVSESGNYEVVKDLGGGQGHVSMKKGERVSFTDNDGTERTGTIKYAGNLAVRLVDDDGKKYEVAPSRIRSLAADHIEPANQSAPAEAPKQSLQLERYDEDGAKPDATKPHGAYFSLKQEGVESPHKDVGPVHTQAESAGKNTLTVPSVKIQHARFKGATANSEGEVSAGVSALKHLASPEEFDRYRKMSKVELQSTLEQQFPGPDYSKYHDSYELLEALGAQMARKAGYDSIHLEDAKAPQFSEYVALKPEAFKVSKSAEAAVSHPPETPHTAPAAPSASAEVVESEPRYKHGSTQANIHPDSDAAQAIESARQRISDSDLAGDGKEIGAGGNHVTVRYGLDDNFEAVEAYLKKQAPFEATLGKTDSFPPSEHSDGAAPIIAPIEAPELHRINAEIEKHGTFAPSSFPDYKPHATIAYVKPEKAARYTGMDVTEGKSFTVDHISITDRDGNQREVKLEGAKSTAAAGLQATKDLAKESGLEISDEQAQKDINRQAEEMLVNFEEIAKFDPELAKQIEEQHPEIKDLLAKARELASNRKAANDEPTGNARAVPEASSERAPELRADGEEAGTPPAVPGKPAPAAPSQPAEVKPGTLADRLYEKLTAGEMPKDNNELRKLVSEFDGKPVDNARLKQAQEDLELAVVRRARDIVGTGDDLYVFNKLVELYQSQPNLNIRTSTSIANQAYSTPAPVAFLADRLAGLNKVTTGYEPTAGNGMLTITGDPANITANEMEPYRANNLRTLGLNVIEGDALKADVPARSVDAVITNPPFGSVKENDKPVKVKVDGYKIGQIDHLIAARALDAMKDDGKATLILGANKVPGGLTTDDRIFFNWLYSHYNVVAHFEVDGALYGRQGASWPIRVINIDGRLASDRISPQEGTIQRVDNWKDVYEQYRQSLQAQRGLPRVERPDSSVPAPAAQNEPRPVRAPAAQPPRGSDQAGPEISPAPNDGVAGAQPGSVPGGDGRQPETVAGPDSSVGPDANVPGQSGLENPRPESANRPERPAKPAGDLRSTSLAAPENQFQAPYSPASQKKDPGVLIPTNMREPLEHAMNALEDAVGDIDTFVQKELGYDSLDELHDAFMGLQVDSIAAAIHQMKQGKAVIIADQTGIGKGRQAAAVIRWAERSGHIPVFITAKPQLFTDMYGDLLDIGSDNIRPFIVNSDESITMPDGKKAFTNRPGLHRRAIEQIRGTRELPADRNAVFLTYSQINVHNAQQGMLVQLAPKSVFILDESHNAGGESETGEFLRTVLPEARGVTYLSATYAKRPDNMPLYFKTDIGQAIQDSQTLMDAMTNGGLPLQTVVSNNLVKAGQMFRRERSYDGVSMVTKVDTAHRVEHTKLADAATTALRAIVAADRGFHEGYVIKAQKDAKKAAKSVKGGGNKASTSVQHSEFTAVVHNFVRQMLLGIKAETAASEALAALKRGEKPLIAVDNTMGSFLSAFVGDHGINVGDELENFDYRTVLSRALDRTRFVHITDPQGNETRVPVTLEELDEETRAKYDEAQKVIDTLDINLPVSPIDWIRMRLEEAGHSVSEITGRNLAVDYSDPEHPKLGQVPMTEQKDKVGTTRRFNDGRLDSIILNVSGSTGISLHASEKFTDQRPRHMIVVQPAQDINIFMQMLGRIHRTGQVKLPSYTILNADLPAEKRPSALLSKKMKSLNANTSSNTESATSIKAADMMNKYGDQIIGQYLSDNPELEDILNVEALDANGEPTRDIARKATGRLAILPVHVQDNFYRDVEQQYNDYINFLDQTNQNELEPRTFDYDAKELNSKVFVEGENKSSPFGEDAVYGEYLIKSQGKPLTAEEVDSEITRNLDGAKDGYKHAQALVADLDKQFDGYIKTLDPANPNTGRARDVAEGTKRFIQNHRIGSTWRLEINGDIYNTAVTNIRSTHKGNGNPFSLSKINVTVAVNGPMRMISVPATQFQGLEVADTTIYATPKDVFGVVRSDMREEAKIITGNLLAAYGELGSTRGNIIHFTKADGTTEQGIQLPKKFEVKDHAQDYRMRSGQHVVKFLKKSSNPAIEKIGIQSRDGNVRIVNERDHLVMITPKSKARGGKYFLDPKITELTGDFVSQGNTMRVTLPRGKEAKVIDLVAKKAALYASPTMADEAKGMAPKNDDAYAMGSGEGAGDRSNEAIATYEPPKGISPPVVNLSKVAMDLVEKVNGKRFAGMNTTKYVAAQHLAEASAVASLHSRGLSLTRLRASRIPV
jgi:2'-5' RNA ligase